MKDNDVRVCPSCGGRNKAKWEFCARCGESLADVPVGAAETTSAATVAGEPIVDMDEPFPWRGILGTVVAISAAVAFWNFKPGKPPDPSIYAVPTDHPSSLPPDVLKPSLSAAAKGLQDGVNLLSANRAAEAVPLLAEAANADSSNAVYRFTYGRALYISGDRAAGVAAFQLASSLDPQNATYRTELGRALMETGQSTAAVAAFEDASKLRPQDASIARSLAQLYQSGGESDKAVAVLRRAAEANPGDSLLLATLGQSLARSGDTAAAVQVL